MGSLTAERAWNVIATNFRKEKTVTQLLLDIFVGSYYVLMCGFGLALLTILVGLLMTGANWWHNKHKRSLGWFVVITLFIIACWVVGYVEKTG